MTNRNERVQILKSLLENYGEQLGYGSTILELIQTLYDRKEGKLATKVSNYVGKQSIDRRHFKDWNSLFKESQFKEDWAHLTLDEFLKLSKLKASNVTKKTLGLLAISSEPLTTQDSLIIGDYLSFRFSFGAEFRGEGRRLISELFRIEERNGHLWGTHYFRCGKGNETKEIAFFEGAIAIRGQSLVSFAEEKMNEQSLYDRKRIMILERNPVPGSEEACIFGGITCSVTQKLNDSDKATPCAAGTIFIKLLQKADINNLKLIKFVKQKELEEQVYEGEVGNVSGKRILELLRGDMESKISENESTIISILPDTINRLIPAN